MAKVARKTGYLVGVNVGFFLILIGFVVNLAVSDMHVDAQLGMALLLLQLSLLFLLLLRSFSFSCSFSRSSSLSPPLSFFIGLNVYYSLIELGMAICNLLFLENYLFRFGFLRGYFLGITGKLKDSSNPRNINTISQKPSTTMNTFRRDGGVGYPADAITPTMVTDEGGEGVGIGVVEGGEGVRGGESYESSRGVSSHSSHSHSLSQKSAKSHSHSYSHSNSLSQQKHTSESAADSH